eukprot:3355967-Prymnesium_polylepis.1
MKKTPASAGQLSMKSFFAKPKQGAAPMEVDAPSASAKRPLEAGAAANKRLATSDVDTPTQSHSTPLARTETAAKRPISSSGGE